MKNEQEMAAFEAAMKKNCHATPIRGRVREYASGNDQALYDGWRMAMEAAGDERELCARVCDDLPAPKSYTAEQASIWDVATLACADEIRARGDK